MSSNADQEQTSSGSTQRRDLMALGIAVGAVLMFVGTGSLVLPSIAMEWAGLGRGPGYVLTTALLLNIALIMFGWHRYKEMAIAIAKHREAEAQARMLAETDALTGCHNRRSIAPATEALMAEAALEGRSVAFLVVDLDDFKQINDMNGHQIGDEVLRVIAARLETSMAPGGLVGRLGGDEFSCVMSYDPRHPEKIDQAAIRLIENVANPIEIDGLMFEITMSVGLASNTNEETRSGESVAAASLMHRADIAMYHAKRKGKNRYFWFEKTMESELRFRNELETGIRSGIRNGEFVPYYEQQVDVDTGDLMGFEMLARWNSPELGLVSPTVFIPIAEEIGVIGELSDQLLRQAFEDAKEWDGRLTVSVNISPVQLRDPWFSQKLLKMMVEHNFPAHRLDVEITESCLHENVSVVRSIITSLRNQGVTISLDDFGTGYSSLAQLRTLPFDRLKIDRSFVTELTGEDVDSKIVDAIVSLGGGLDLPMTAEGIENPEILEALKKIGHLKGQGYHYGEPEDAATTKARLAKAGLLAKPLSDDTDKAADGAITPFVKEAKAG